jgi:ElaB/YqjD/DUF883 family membrane-anchored ribosome-binding protein
METNYDNKIEIIQRKIKIKHLNELIKKSNSDGKDYHINDLQKIIKMLKERSIDQIEATKSSLKKESSKDKNLFDNIDQYMFNKPWNRLPEVHKFIKIKEYVNKSLIIYENEKKDKLIKQMFAAVKQKKLTRKGSVNYDSVNCRIISVPSLKYNKNKEIYFLSF